MRDSNGVLSDKREHHSPLIAQHHCLLLVWMDAHLDTAILNEEKAWRPPGTDVQNVFGIERLVGSDVDRRINIAADSERGFAFKVEIASSGNVPV